MSPTLSFSTLALVLLESAVGLLSLSFGLTVDVPAFGAVDVISPVRTLAFAFSDFISVFFSIAGASGVVGVAGFIWAKLIPPKVKLATERTKTLIMFFTSITSLLCFRRDSSIMLQSDA